MQPERAVTDETPMASISATPSAELSTAAESAPGAVLSGADATGDDADQAVELEQVWAALREALARRMQPEQYDTWFRRSALASVDDTTVRVAVQNTFARDWIKNYYTRAIDEAARELWSDGNPPRAIEIVVDPEAVARAAAAAPPEPEARAADTPAAPQPAETAPATPPANSCLANVVGGVLCTSDIVLNRRYTFDNFVVGPCNRFAHAASVGVGEAPGTNYNPFFLHGSVGLGKTHLLQSMCWSLLEREPNTRILYLSCETFVNHFISALEDGDLQAFRHKYRNVDVLVVDDIHILANKERTQEEFFHTFNTLYNAGKQIVLSSDSPPRDIPTLQERLVSRFKWGLVTEIEAPCYETRMAILKRKSRDRGTELPDDVAQLLAENVESNIRELEGAVTRLMGFASLSGQAVTPELARQALSDLFPATIGAPTIHDILSLVTEHFSVRLADLQSRRRTQSIVLPRQVAMYLARKITPLSLEEIGSYFGGRDHSTVLHAVNKVSGTLERDPAMARLAESLLGRLGSA
ncbi:MAG: chromosomal replication initiator protein DnaA [Planctomycetota bacterium]|nr:chromosomal replication initiator protein DnaA [Planctomycetota bacterium]MDP6519664.1 chromosomal replication initiator protein DnaA [Planctomycetota bacterium]MDP6837920.1 chromosomal replication initiator protein DnaA [Planctomycetota bacterium]